ncbi:hypothetical protein BofuT4_P082890.1 [Botrytis cinerea T4]|uniref:Uncharacterized protein n=1 Tax=Botryotinia fuckeliana (strain T4) TaxID=999810 RepID=G2YJT8_BOTF4|nr:hypothetical protein BofuT4_P082890.1 [Botrytis cinerea T4]
MRPSSKSHIGVDFTMSSNVPPESRDSSAPPSPTATRTLQRSASNLSDERTPLLQSAGRSRIRLGGAAEINRPYLPSHHSYSGSLRGSRHHSRAGSWDARIQKHVDHRRQSLV